MGPSPTPPPATGLPVAVQVVATIETYAASQFFPPEYIVVKDVPLTLAMTRLHSEHVNKFSIDPFIFSRPFAQPGELANVIFTPDQSGEFKMRNIGHFFDADFIVVDSVAVARALIAEKGIQEFSLIHDLESGLITPDRIVVQKEIPVKVYNVSLAGEGTVSIDPFYRAAELRVKQRRVISFEFVPNLVGEFPIRDGAETVIGTLVVE